MSTLRSQYGKKRALSVDFAIISNILDAFGEQISSMVFGEGRLRYFKIKMKTHFLHTCSKYMVVILYKTSWDYTRHK